MLTIAFFISNGWIEVPLIKRVCKVVLGSGLYLVHLIRSAAPKTDRKTHHTTDSAKIPAQAPTGNSAIIEEDSMDFFGQVESFQFTEAQKRSVVVVPSHHIHNRYFPPIGLSDWIAYCTLWKYSIILNPFLFVMPWYQPLYDMSYFSWPQRCATGGAAQGLPQAAKALPALHFRHDLCGPSNPRQPGIRSVPCPESGNINHNSREKQQFTALSAETKFWFIS